MNTKIIEVKHLYKTYKSGEIETEVLMDINLTINKGDFVAIMGPSGSGKSTLMHILGGLDLPTKGEYFLDGKEISKMTDDELSTIRNQKIGFVFQAYNLLPRTSALDNVMLPMEYDGVDDGKQLEIAKKYLTMVGLEKKMANTPSQLSGGQQQRVAIARALVMNPAMILADEPTGNIASNQADEIMKIFTEINEKEGHTIVMITHEPDIAAYAKRVIHIRDGKLEEGGVGVDKVSRDSQVGKKGSKHENK